jgi:6-phospho-beta-glucosidase
MSLRIAVIGGGSTYTPELVDGIIRRHHRLPTDELVLMDPNAERLEVVGGLAGRMARRAGWPGRIETTTDTDAALEGATFVLVQLRVGGQAARLIDETLPPRFGTIGQETTGAGGFAKALRTVPVVLDLAERVARRSSPAAWIVDFTNPVGIVTQALLDHGHRAIGLCNVAIGLQRRMAARFEVAPERIQLEHVGLNHLSWVRAVVLDGIDRLPELLLTAVDDLAQGTGLPATMLQTLGAIPSYYLRYYYRFTEVLKDQQAGGHVRASEVLDIESRLLELYRDPALDEKPALLDRRGGAFYSEAAAQLIEALHRGSGDVQVVDTYNQGALPDLPDDAVVEVPARIDADGPHPVPLAPLAPDLRALVQHTKGYEQLTIEAASTGDRRIALRALMANPLVLGYDMAEPLLDALLDAGREHLPRFGAAA